MSKRDLFRLEDLKKQVTYILSRRPDEFGLVPDEEGFINYFLRRYLAVHKKRYP